MKKQTLILGCLLLLLACRKEEIAIPNHNPGKVITATVDMTKDYRWQIYFDLKTNSVVGKNRKKAWDLGFETSATGFHVVINSSKFMTVYNTGETDFATVSTIAGEQLNDAVSGNFDSTAIGDWRNTKPVYIIDRGFDVSGVDCGKVKFQLLAYDDNSYTIQFANLDNTAHQNKTIKKDSLYNFTFLSFDQGGKIVNIEPPKATWDLCFTQYTDLIPNGNDKILYLVTGCLLNRYKTQATTTTQDKFENINALSINNTSLSSAINTIGYAWKERINEVYVIDVKKNYIIQNHEGILYKLRFIDFYNNQGIKGNPKFEFQEL